MEGKRYGVRYSVQRLAAAVARAGVTPTQLAAAAGVDAATVKNHLTGKTQPKADILAVYAGRLGRRIEYFFEAEP
ncbi:MAG TPA: helix-turn-helix domain-containing protein [Armatimonadota bacterium]|nr:helix-turn-helix domain-containing protein [Armatimonadota bacterium]